MSAYTTLHVSRRAAREALDPRRGRIMRLLILFVLGCEATCPLPGVTRCNGRALEQCWSDHRWRTLTPCDMGAEWSCKALPDDAGVACLP